MIHAKWFAFILFAALFILVSVTGCENNDEDDSKEEPADDDDDDDDDDNDDNDDNDDDNNDDDSMDPIELVDLFVGTGGIGYGAAQLHPGPQMPNGMVRPGPDTSRGGLFYFPEFQHYAGYWDKDTHIRGFSQNRMIGTGDSDYGNVRLMPLLFIDDSAIRDHGYLAVMDKASESAQVGKYQVRIQDTEILVEVSALKRAATYRFTYPASKNNGYLVIDIGGSIRPGDVSLADLQIDAYEGEITGSLYQEGEFSSDYDGIELHFAISFSEIIADYGTFNNGTRNPLSSQEQGDDIGAYVGFDLSSKKPVIVKVALSFIDPAQAKDNLLAEIPGFDFEQVVQENKEAWREVFEKIEISGGTQKQRQLFYTALYRSFMMPTLFTEQGGHYLGFDDAEHTVDGFTYYTDMSLWDTFRSLHPLITLLDPTLSRDFIVSLIKMAEQGGYLPKWPHGNGYTDDMIGTHTDVVITEAYLKGVTDFDVETGYSKMFLHATEWVPEAGRSDLENYKTLGYCTTDNTGAAASRTLEYTFDDYCIARLAQALGYQDDADYFDDRANNYVNIWDDGTKFFRGRDSAGNWHSPFIPWFPWMGEYTQGNARHWLWFVPHDVPGLIALFGGEEEMTGRLDEFFAKSANVQFDGLPNLYYWHGNQHDMHSVYMFNEAGRPDLTQKWVRYVLDAEYDLSPEGLAGNEDGGTLMAWYVFSAIGLFPLNPCSTRYQIGSPLFDEISLHLDGGDFSIIAVDNSAENAFIQEATLNGNPLEVPWVDHSQIVNGGELVLIMGPFPSSWGRVSFKK